MLEKLQKNQAFKVVIYLFSIGTILFNTSNSNLNFVIHGIAMIPLAFMLGELTANISDYLGEKKSGLLTATLGNMPEIIMSIWSLKLGLTTMVKGVLIGSIVNNMLLVLGVSIFLGGAKYKQQGFNKNIAKMNFSMLLLAISSIIILSCIDMYATMDGEMIYQISKVISALLIIIYLLSLVFSIYTHSNLFSCSDKCENQKVNIKKFLILIFELIILLVLIYFASEKIMIDANIFINRYNVSETFMGIILVPLIGNIGESISAVVCAVKNKINLSLEIAVGSSIQIALFSVPVLILIGSLIGVQLTLVFSLVDIIIIGIAILMSYIVFSDGKTYWFEGSILITLYIIITLCYYYM